MRMLKTLKRVGAVMLTLALLTSMMSVMGAFPMSAAAQDEVDKYEVDFYQGLDSKVKLNWAGGSSYNALLSNPASNPEAEDYAWLSERFDSYKCFTDASNPARTYLGGDSSVGSDFFGYFYYSQREAVGITGADRGLCFTRENQNSSELFWHVTTLVLKNEGKVLDLKNFEATVKFAMLSDTLTGGLLFGFHESDPGKYTFNWNYTERRGTGSVLAIGNKVDGTVGNDAWKFFDKGTVIEDEYLYGAESFGKTLTNQYHTLTVRVVNGTATFTVTDKDGAVVKTMSQSYTSTNGGISLGFSDRDMIVNKITVTELDNDGNAVDLGFTKAYEEAYAAADKFNGHFATGLNRSDNTWTGTQYKYETKLNDPTAASATVAEKHYQEWLSTNFDSYMNFNNDIQLRTYFGEPDKDGSSYFSYVQFGSLTQSDADRGLMFNNCSSGGELFWSINTLVPKHNGEVIKVKNFEATVKFSMTNTLSGGLLFAFHESNAGQYTGTTPTKQSSGSVLAIGNSVDTKAAWNAAGSTMDAWKFYADGSVEANYMTNVDKQFAQYLNGQYYTLKVKAVNGTATFTLTSADGSFNETMTKTYTTIAGGISLGLTGREIMVNSIDVVELDGSGLPVDLGTYVKQMNSMNIEGLPSYEGGSGVTAHEGRDGYKTYVIKGTDANEYTTFVSAVEAAGWTKYSENQAANNLFATYQKGNHTVYMYYLPAENRVHVIDMPTGAVLPTTQAADYTKVCEPLFTQVQLSYATASEGMSYLLRLSDGRFIVIDGGDDEPDYLESIHLYHLMEEQNALDKITVAAWIVTHAHGDHQLVPTEFLNKYINDDNLVIEQVLFNYPTSTPNDAQTNAFIEAVNAWGASGTKHVTPFIGQEFYYADAKLEFLHTIDAYEPGQIDGADFNNTTSVFSIEIADQKIMILGDMHEIGNDQLVKLYGENLKSDIVQFNHHGVGGGTRELYVEIDPAVVMLPAGVFHHTNTYNYYRYHAPDDDRTKQAFKWLYNNESGNVKEVFLMGFKEVTLTLPYRDYGTVYMANRNNNGYVFEEAAVSDVVVPNPFFELDLGEATNSVIYKDQAYNVPSLRVEKNAAVLSQTVEGLSDVLNGNNSFELFVAIDNLPDVLTGETYYMFGTSTMGLTLENNTLNVSLRKGNNTAIVTNGDRYYKGNVVGGGIVNHIVGTYDASTNTLSIYENGVLITTAQYVEGFTAEDVLNLGSTGFNSKSGYTVLGARVYDECLDADAVAATYWNSIQTLCGENHTFDDHMDTECNVCHAIRTVVGAVVEDDNVYVNVTLKPGEEIRGAIWLYSNDYENDHIVYPVIRVGFRENEAASNRYQVVLPENVTIDLADFEVKADIITPSKEDPNVASVGVSLSEKYIEGNNLRFISRFTRVEGEEDAAYVVLGGEEYKLLDYGVIVASHAGMQVDLGNYNLTEDDYGTVRDAMTVDTNFRYTKVVSFAADNAPLYDNCDAYVDLALTLTNIKNKDIDMDYFTRPYIVVQDGENELPLYGDLVFGAYSTFQK